MRFDVWHLTSDLRSLRSNLGHRNLILALNALWEGETITSTPVDQVRSKHHRVHVRSQKARNGLFGRSDDGLIFVQRGVKDDWDPSLFMKAAYQRMVERIC